MQYSLLHRFQGCLVGMVLGERLGLYVEAQRFPPWRSLNQPPQLNPRSESLPDQSCADMHHWNPGVQSPAIASTQPTAWSTLALRYAEGLIQIGTWRIEDHHPPVAQGSPSTLTDSGLAIATLPIALFFHDNLVKQRRHLEETVQAWCSDFEVSDRVVTFGYAIAQALKEHLYPHSFIAQTLAYLRVTADASAGSTPHWLTELDQVRTLLQTGANLSTVAQRWQSPSTQDSRAMSADAQTSAIALALYCFLSTPNNLRLAIIRAARIGYHSSIVCALTGALAGAYTGTAGIPVDWSLVSQTRQVSAWELPPLEIHQLSSRLLAVWSGVYNSSVPQPYPAVVAAPWVIRPY